MSQNSVNTDMPIQVAKGGTGAASHTAYSVLCGGTTSTSDIQPIAGVGSAGQALISNGAATLPTFQNQSGGSSPSYSVGFNNDQLPSSHYHLLSLNDRITDIPSGRDVADEFFAQSFVIRADVTAATTALYVTDSSASQKFRFAIFTDSSGDFGTRLFESGELDASTNGLKTYSSSVSYSAGPAWLVIVAKNTTDLDVEACTYTINTAKHCNASGSVIYNGHAWAGTYGEIASDLTFSGKTITSSTKSLTSMFITIS